MIETALSFLERQLNQHLNIRIGNNHSDWVTVSTIVNQSGELSFENITLSLISVEEERANKSQNTFKSSASNTFDIVNPEIKLNLYLLFAANFGAHYREALKFLSYVITYFQGVNVFTHQNSPDLDPSIEKLIMDLISPSFAEMHNIWGYVGAKYLPSVMYKARLLVVQQDMVKATVKPITETQQIDKNMNV